MAPPLDPDSDQAQQWLQEELRRGVYSEQRSFWEWLWEKVSEFLGRIFAQADGIQGMFLPLLILTVAAGIITLTLIYGRAVRRPRTARGTTAAGVWQGDDPRSAHDLRSAARRAASDSDYSLAVVEQFRALVRSVEERGAIDPTEGMTAVEVARDIARAFPPHAPDVRRGADLFDSALYGTGRANSSDYAFLVDLEQRITAAPAEAR